MIQITGKIRDIYVKSRKAFHGDCVEYYAECVIDTEGTTFFFNSPAVKKIDGDFRFPQRGNDFLRLDGDRLSLKVFCGDIVTIEGRLKHAVPYEMLTHVRLLHLHEHRVHRMTA